jgi:hypothetical protein
MLAPDDGSRTRHLQIQEGTPTCAAGRTDHEEIADDGAGGESRTLSVLITKQALGHPSGTGMVAAPGVEPGSTGV